MRLTASLVLYNNPPLLFEKAMASFLDGASDGQLFVVDNSPSPSQSDWFAHPRVRYTHTKRNLGFGAAHNVAIHQLNGDGVHLLLNPDIEFGPEVLPALCETMSTSPEIAALMPRIVYPDGSIQHLCKLLPTPLDLLARRFLPSRAMRQKLDSVYELHRLPQDRPSSVPNLSGCMLLLRTRLLQQIGGFDDRYFMYLEDIDLVRRLGDLGDTRYQPSVRVVHAYAKGSYRNKRLLAYHIVSAVKYFNKWGWLFDRTRRIRNHDCKQQLVG